VGGERATLSWSADYWDGVAREALRARTPPLWRLAADEANRRLLSRWLPANGARRLLKTDLFDELTTGGIAPFLGGRAERFFAVDLSRVAAGVVRNGSPNMFVASGDVRALPFRTDAFSVVVSHSTLDHFATRAEIEVALREIQRVLQPGGLLVLTLDNLRHSVVALRNALAPAWRRLGALPYAVGASYGPRGLSRVLERSGFELLEVTAIHHFPRLVLVAFEHLLRGDARSRWRAGAVRVAVAAEVLGAWPTRQWTGQYVAVLARAPGSAPHERDDPTAATASAAR